MAREKREFGTIADKVVFENERVRVWELSLPPGAKGPVHRHELDHLLIQLGGDRVAVHPEPDTQGPYKEYLEADVFPGNVIFVNRGGVEVAHNVGKRTYHEIIVELKD